MLDSIVMENRASTEPQELLPLVIGRAERWDHRGQLEFGRNFSNLVYRSRGAEITYLRVTSGAQRSRDLIEAELEFVEYLRSRGIPAAAALPAGNENSARLTLVGMMKGNSGISAGLSPR